MSKLQIPSISILLLLVSAGHALDNNSGDILNIGYRILKDSNSQQDVYGLINDLWHDLFLRYRTWFHHELTPNALLKILGLPESALNCSTSFGINDQDPLTKCPPKMIRYREAIKSFQELIKTINVRIDAIDTMYRRVFASEQAETSKLFEVTDNLYKLIMDNCKNKSTCVFDQAVGKHLPESDVHGIRSSLAISGEVYFAYVLIAFHLLKGYATDIYRQYHNSNTSSLTEKDIGVAKFLMHTRDIGQLATLAIKDAQRYILREEPSAIDHSLDSPYLSLKWYLSKIIVNEATLNANGSCHNTCHDYEDRYQHPSDYGPHGETDVCRGALSSCTVQPAGYLKSAVSHSRRYDGIKVIDGLSYGNVDDVISPTAPTTDYLYYTRSPDLSSKCAVCLCLCDDYENPHTIRTFSLKEVTSNIQENKVVTGLKLVELNGVIYIRIRESILKDLDRVGSTHWTRINAIDKKTASPYDFHQLRLKNKNFIDLDTISIQDEFVQHHILNHDINHIFFPHHPHLLTGVKFTVESGILRFGIRLSAWNPKTKRISQRKWNNWIFNPNIQQRTRIALQNPDVPTKTTDNVEFRGKDYYVNFEATDDLKDFGQTTVPFLDARPVITDPPMPLAGAGLFFKGKKGYGGVIGLKLVSIDFSELIVTELNLY